MKQYPSIQGSSDIPFGKPCIAFYKYDGSNLRWEWNPKKGWYKYGTRNRLFDKGDPDFGMSIELFQDTMGEEIARRCKSLEHGLQSAIVYTEFFGPNSFAGLHINEPKELKLFDVNLYKRGIMKPRDFVKNFGDLNYTAKVIYDGNCSKEFVNDIRNNKYLVIEGVVAKGTNWMCKIKTFAYLEKLKLIHRNDWNKYWE